MPYKAALTKSFLRELRKLPEDVRTRVLRAVDEILANPFSGLRLQGELEGRWRWRVGKYRIIYRVEPTSQTVILLDVGLRKTIY
ncbi:MAG: type II toxin-antitoxin system RelE/ParE family toxin [Nitrososphaeria archaeon]|nr:type II toxin-antitoxin system RelE/ParE family toxin [Nitrososphaeria archaeon]